MSFFTKLFTPNKSSSESESHHFTWIVQRSDAWVGPPVAVSLFAGELTEAPAEAICTSTNPRLSLVEGTGGSVRDQGGWEVKRACEEILEAEFRATGQRQVQPGSAHCTGAGSLGYRGVIHCVASDATHRSSRPLIEQCVRNALARASEAGLESLAMPVFGSGHAAFAFEDALRAMCQVIASAQNSPGTIVIVVHDLHRIDQAREVIESVPGFRPHA